MTVKWQVKQLEETGDWGVRHGEEWWRDIFPTHSEAMIWAERYAVMDLICDGYLARVGELKRWLNAGYR